ncbi:Retinaldehyde-binding protein 1-like protein 1 [Caligus rogercresseyi]|uniref:Retinaldehyde-binding protein 1-like protein 1 n=1 Tax=Caligus rogercresseyi TaxID=217165 RepID=A0A7T8JVS8_CALRO|nr:Retinaldehyde-binding protein 1-like protein 1 [Caligus rogercresseyi]
MKFDDAYEAEDERIELSPWLARAAQEELGETPALRRKCLKEFRDWIRSKEEYAKGSIRLDSNFLLRFLRFAKFNIHDTQIIFEKYISARVNHPEWFTKLDPQDEKIHSLISRATSLFSRKRMSAMDASRFTSSDVIRVHILFYESLLEEPENQILGLSYVMDERDTNWSHISVWTPSEISKAFSCTEGALPIRHRSVHLVYLPWTLMLVYHFAKNLLSTKLRKRLHLHSSFEELVKMNNLSSISMEKMITSFLAKLDERRDPVLALDVINSSLQ